MTPSPRTSICGLDRSLYLIGIILALAGCGTGDGGASIPPFSLYESIALGDFDGDGKLDIAVAASFVSGAPPHPGFTSVIRQNSSTPGTFLTGVHYAVGSDPFSLATGDLNGDGRLDLATASTTLNVSGNTPMPFTVLFANLSSPGTFLPGVSMPAGIHNEGIALGDLNGDGRNDLAVAACSNGVLTFLQSSPGTFTSAATISAGTCPGAVAVGDIDNDGRMDLAVASPISSGGSGIFILRQDPGNPGTFVQAGIFSAGLQPTALKIADINNDGFADIAVANLGSPSDGNTASVSVLQQNPASPGTFQTAVNYVTGFRSVDVAVGDLNSDSRPDLVVANMGSLGTTGSVSVLLQDPLVQGAFTPRINYPGISEPLSVAIGDLNGDGLPDIAVADDGAVVLLNNPGAPGRFFPSALVGK